MRDEDRGTGESYSSLAPHGRVAMASSGAAAGAAIDKHGNPQAWNLRLVGHCPMEGRGDGMHINLKDGYAFFGHMGDFGIGPSIVAVRDPTAPRLVNQIMAPSGIHS